MFYTPLKVAYHWMKGTLTHWNKMTAVLFRATK